MNELRSPSHCSLAASFLLAVLSVPFPTESMAVPPPNHRPGGVISESDELLALTFSADGTLLASGGKDTTVQVWELKTNRMRVLGASRQMIRSLSFSPDGRTLAAAGDEGVVYLWDVQSGKVHDKLRGPEGEITCVTYA